MFQSHSRCKFLENWAGHSNWLRIPTGLQIRQAESSHWSKNLRNYLKDHYISNILFGYCYCYCSYNSWDIPHSNLPSQGGMHPQNRSSCSTLHQCQNCHLYPFCTSGHCSLSRMHTCKGFRLGFEYHQQIRHRIVLMCMLHSGRQQKQYRTGSLRNSRPRNHCRYTN